MSPAPDLQSRIETLLEAYQVLPVGSGFIDLIVPKARKLKLIDEMSALGVAIRYFTFWCQCIDDKKITPGCPHGYGGPINPFGEGRFSECCHLDPTGIPYEDVSALGLGEISVATTRNAKIRQYIEEAFPKESFWSPCLRFGFWLDVPDGWKRLRYFPARGK